MNDDTQQNQSPETNPFALPEPAWTNWQEKNHAPLWQAVALCCNISPDALSISGNGKQLSPIAEHQSHKFATLLNLARNALAAERLKVKSYNAESPENSEADLAYFAKWAGSKGWVLPLSFPQLDIETPIHISGWPWGRYDTYLLRLLAQAAEKFWKNYDPNDPTTAPTNDEVSRWIAKQLPPRLGEKTASVMATILRADELPSGPRK